MSEAFSREDLDALIEHSGPISVSLFMPTAAAGKEVEANPIRFKNLVRQAERQLKETVPTADLLAPARALLDDAAFWRHQQRGLACFLADDFFEHYRLTERFEELLVVDRRFHVRPLLPLLSQGGRYYVLCPGRERVRLYEATRHALREIEPRKMPTRFAEVLGTETEESHLQFHTGTPGGSGRRAASFHGQGGGSDDDKRELRKFYSAVDAGLIGELDDKEAPLLLAGLDHLTAIFRDTCSHPHLLERGLTVNADGLPPEELRDRTWQLVHPRFDAERRHARSEYERLAGTHQTSDRAGEIVPASADGRVSTLFLRRGATLWGSYDRQSREVVPSGRGDGAEELLDLAAVQTLGHGGRVFFMDAEELPADEVVAAVYRY
jgi:hypothetical protein